MRVWAALLFVLVWGACPALARNAVVTAGEHAGFPRVVVQFGGPVDWQLGRTPQGYSLRISPEVPVYDMKTVFNLIGKTRLTAAAMDPATGDLALSLACPCYAMPYEERPGVIVIDLRDGTAPPGSSFELPLESSATQGQPKVNVTKPSYDWTKLPSPAADASSALPFWERRAKPNPLQAETMESLRLSLIQDLGRGASHGLVDMVVPAQNSKDEVEPAYVPQHVQTVAKTDTSLNIDVRRKAALGRPLTGQGGDCWADDQMEIALWGGQQPIAAQLGPQRAGLSAEFDIPDLNAVTRAIRFQLFIGFGAEARSLIRAFAPNAPDAALWLSMAAVLDRATDPAPAFAGMEDCETSAALWATLADAKAAPTSPQAKAAVLRGFSALPPHLRRLFGPDLVDHLLQLGDITQATALYDATLRAPGDENPDFGLMKAQMSRAIGKPDTALAQISALAKLPGSGSAEPLLALIEAQVPLGKPITFAQVQALEAYATERRGGVDAARFERALVLAKAGSGDFDGAFAGLNRFADAAPTVWQLLAQSAPRSAFLTHASLAPSDPFPPAAIPFAEPIANRMLELGLSDQAALWAAHVPQAPPVMLARIKMAQGDAESALALLHSDDSAKALALKAQSYQALGQAQKAAEIYAHLGQPKDHWQAVAQARDWQALATDGPAPWREVAALLINKASVAATGPLAHDAALIARSAATRDAILALLGQTKAPL